MTMKPNQFRTLRVAMGYTTMAELAPVLARTRENILSYELGKQKIPRVVELAMCALALGCSGYDDAVLIAASRQASQRSAINGEA